MSIKDEQKKLQKSRSQEGHELKKLHRAEKEADVLLKNKSVCCNADMFESGQCVVCGADGTHFEMDDREKQELIDEKILINFQ